MCIEWRPEEVEIKKMRDGILGSGLLGFAKVMVGFLYKVY